MLSRRFFFLLFFFFAVSLIPAASPRPARINSACAPGCVYYIWSDAVRALGAPGPSPKAAFVHVCAPDGSCGILDVQEWAPDADCEKLYPDMPRELDRVLGKLVKAGALDAETLRGLRVYVLPAFLFAAPNSKAPNGEELMRGCQLPGQNAVVVAGQTAYVEHVFLHEIGHLVAEKKLGAFGNDWQSANESGAEYLKLRGYPDGRRLDGETQAALPWGERAAEWFAEDFAHWAGVEAGSLPPPWGLANAPPGREAWEWFGQVFSRG